VKAVVVVAPFFDPSETVPDVPTTLILGTCDKDTGTTGAGYLTAARTGVRTAASWRLVVRGATDGRHRHRGPGHPDQARTSRARCRHTAGHRQRRPPLPQRGGATAA